MKLVVEPPKFVLLHGRRPYWVRAYADDFFCADRPYLKLPYGGGDLGRDYCVARVYPPWRISRCERWKLVREGDAWYWLTGKDAK